MVEAPDVYEPESGEAVSDVVVRALADARDVEPAELDLRLYDTVDPEALDALFATADCTPRVSFTLGGLRVVVDESRSVYVTAAEDTPSPDPHPRPDPQILRGAASPWRLVLGGRESDLAD